MLSRVATFAIDGVDPRQVWVEVDIRQGLPTFTIVGLGDVAVRESRDRIRSAILNSNFEFPSKRITANLAPAFLRKAGPGFDAALAIAVLIASEQVPPHPPASYAVFGELSLGGELRDSPGALAVAEGARRCGLRRLILPRERAREAALVEGLEIAGVETLRAAAEILRGAPLPPVPQGAPRSAAIAIEPDLADVRGQRAAVLAIEIAAAGGHNLLLEGPPGTGKTMLARRLPSILPAMTREEAIEVTRIHSVAGLHPDSLVAARPFRAPHHTISPSGLVGGGSAPRPGEATLAHHGVLFLDELSEFQRSSLDALRQPLEDGCVTIVRGQRALQFPTRFMLIAASNPCPCGFAGDGDRCECGESDLRRHRRRLSGPLLDRMDLLVSVARPAERDLRTAGVTDSEAARGLVAEAREWQWRRLAGTGARCNGEMDGRAVRRCVHLDDGADRALSLAYATGALSARGRYRILRVARTIADLEHHPRVTRDDLLTALSLRQRTSTDSAPRSVTRQPSRARACGSCNARAWLLSRLGGHLEHARGRIDAVLALQDEQLLAAVGGPDRDRIGRELANLRPQELRDRIAEAGIETICRCRARYPERLRALASPPAVLHVAGVMERFLELADEDPVAIVGARRASPYGLEVARALGRDLARAGVTVLSGMALGIDSAAHGGALGAGAPTVAVLPGSADRPYPASRRALHRQIVARGAAISELPPGASIWRWTFPARNRIIAALAATTVVVQAGGRSGSLLTAGFAQAVGRPVGAVPGQITAPHAAGTNSLLARGAYVVRGAQDVLDALFGAGAHRAPADARAELSPEARVLLAAIAEGTGTDAALARAGLPAGEGLAALASLELEGYVKRAAGGRYTAIP